MLDGNAATVIIALLGILATQSAAIVWVVRWAVTHYGNDIRAHTIAANKLGIAGNKMAASVDKSVEASDEMLVFMKALNGKLAKATIQTVKEQHIEHQHIQTEVVEHQAIKD